MTVTLEDGTTFELDHGHVALAAITSCTNTSNPYVMIGAFATSGVTSIKMVGIGMVIAIVLDATIVRALLVPAMMRLMGRANWWAPGPLARVYRRYGIREGDSPAPRPAEPAHAG